MTQISLTASERPSQPRTSGNIGQGPLDVIGNALASIADSKLKRQKSENILLVQSAVDNRLTEMKIDNESDPFELHKQTEEIFSRIENDLGEQITPELNARIQDGRRRSLALSSQKQGVFNNRAYAARIDSADQNTDLEELREDIQSDRSQSLAQQDALLFRMEGVSLSRAEIAINGIIDQSVLSDAFDPVGSGKAIQGQINRMVSQGIDEAKAQDAAIEAVVQAAIRNGDFEILDSMDHASRDGVLLSQTQNARNARDRASTIISNQRLQRDSANLKKESLLKKQRVDAIGFNAIDRLIGDPNASIDDLVLSAAQDDPVAAIRLFEYKNKIQSDQAESESDPESMKDIYAQMMESPEDFDPQVIIGAAVAGEISQETVAQMFTDLDRFKKQLPANLMIKDPRFKAIVDGVVNGIQGGLLNFTGQAGRNAQQAKASLIEATRDWFEANPEGTRAKFFSDIQKEADAQVENYSSLNLRVRGESASTPQAPSDGFTTLSNPRSPARKRGQKFK